MFNYVKFEVTFPSTGKTMKGEHFFHEGLTAITGPNGEGKSLILEMLDYALHGTKALRGEASEYANLKAYLNFTVKGKQYNVTRNSKVTLSEIITDQAVFLPIATGVKPVNKAIDELFGYSYEVFNMANFCKQDEVGKLGQMKPAERKNLVDETIGLAALDDLTTFIQKEITTLNGVVGGMESVLAEPLKPEVKELKSSKEYEEDCNRLSVDVQKFNRWREIIKRDLVAPEEVKEHPEKDKLAEYKAQWQDINASAEMINRLLVEQSKLPPYIDVSHVTLHPRDSEIESLRAVQTQISKLNQEILFANSELQRLEECEVTQEELNEEIAQANLHERWSKMTAIREESHELECPNCFHKWHEDNGRLAAFEDILYIPEPRRARFTASEIETLRFKMSYQPRRQELVALIQAKAQELVELGDDPTPVLQAIFKQQSEWAKAENIRTENARRARVEDQLEQLTALYKGKENPWSKIQEIEANEKKLQVYLIKLEHYASQKHEQNDAAAFLSLLPMDLEEQLKIAQTNWNDAIVQETLLTQYEKAVATYTAMVEKMKGFQAELADWKKGKDAVLSLRAKVKGYILPSLNMVSSRLIAEMTGGVMSSIYINEDFEIKVDGQSLETLSGAGKSVANLAIRISLGQVLCGHTFPALALDEIDASFDDNRADYTAQCVRRLTGAFKQVLLVSHKKRIEADNYIGV